MNQKNKKIKFYSLDEKTVSHNLKVKIIKSVVTIYFT